MTMLEQMVETKSWKASRGLAKCSKCRLCGQQRETVGHLLASIWPSITALMILAISRAKEFNLVEKDMKWYKQKWCRGIPWRMTMWDFEFNLRKTTTSRRLDLTLEVKQKKILWICDMACPQENNIVTKRDEKRAKYRQLRLNWENGEQSTRYILYLSLSERSAEVSKKQFMKSRKYSSKMIWAKR